MTNYESGRYIAQKYNHDISRLLQAIYDGTIEPKKSLNDFEKGVIDEVNSWLYHSLKTSSLLVALQAGLSI